MDKRGVLAAAVAVELVAAGGAVAARLPREGASATVEQVSAASPRRASSSPSPTPLPVPSSAVPTSLPTGVPTLPPITLPPSLPITLPPLPTVSLPPLPTVSLPPPPLCLADVGAEALPAFTKSVDISGDDGPVLGPVSGGGRIWYTVQESDHVSGVDVANGSRVEIATKPDTIVIDVAGPYVWTIEDHHYAVAYDVTTRREALRYGREPTATDGLTYEVRSVRGDAQGGAWLLVDDYHDASVAVVRVNGAGGQVWSTKLPGAASNGWGIGREENLAVRDGSAYVGIPSADGTRTFWRVAPDGTLAARVTMRHPHNMVDLPVVAGPDGVYAMLYMHPGQDARVVRLDEGLRETAAVTVPAGFDLFVGAGAVWVSGSDCSYNLSRLDPTTLRRTHLWRAERGQESLYGVVHGGHVWTLHAPQSDPVALHRYDLP